jgi:hypothetical protein
MQNYFEQLENAIETARDLIAELQETPPTDHYETEQAFKEIQANFEAVETSANALVKDMGGEVPKHLEYIGVRLAGAKRYNSHLLELIADPEQQLAVNEIEGILEHYGDMLHRVSKLYRVCVLLKSIEEGEWQ